MLQLQRSNLDHTYNLQLLPHMGNLWGASFRHFGENWLYFKITTLYFNILRQVYQSWSIKIGWKYKVQ